MRRPQGRAARVERWDRRKCAYSSLSKLRTVAGNASAATRAATRRTFWAWPFTPAAPPVLTRVFAMPLEARAITLAMPRLSMAAPISTFRSTRPPAFPPPTRRISSTRGPGRYGWWLCFRPSFAPGVSRNSFKRPHYQDVDGTITGSFGLPKGKVIGDSTPIEIRADAFNFSNQTNLNSSSISTK